MTAAQVLIVDDHPVVRRGLRSMVDLLPGLECTGEAESGTEAIRAAAEAAPDVVLLDLRMPGADGVQIARALRRVAPRARILIVTVDDDPSQVQRALEAGVDGFLLKTATLEELGAAIRRTLRGERVVAAELMGPVLNGYAALLRERTTHEADLSTEELRILDGVAHGHSYRDLASAMYMSEITVRRRVQDIYRKLDVRDRAHAVAVAMRRGLI
jgi:two-component system, NarL family, response regulator LiaR